MKKLRLAAKEQDFDGVFLQVKMRRYVFDLHR